jgi:hypothetical protein
MSSPFVCHQPLQVTFMRFGIWRVLSRLHLISCEATIFSGQDGHTLVGILDGPRDIGPAAEVGQVLRKQVRPFIVFALWFGDGRQNSRCAPIRSGPLYGNTQRPDRPRL